ncbi:uncharacterized protein YALI1_D31371g [Yarrowia lipolytica]|uniref:Uncharacterized protein n=1 Tax=Yarrowia lipolytica TaxID=4952 RepID=A0A1D8NFZ3_YARLL|nr:hypothetical protein YALI1_D31371g [Yarrowia lipolytica]
MKAWIATSTMIHILSLQNLNSAGYGPIDRISLDSFPLVSRINLSSNNVSISLIAFRCLTDHLISWE